jgi:formylglycine-generating enzyme required for sulfatase activity
MMPRGTFHMGSPADEADHQAEEGPVHEVRIRYALAVSKYPITRREWKQFVKEAGHQDPSDCVDDHQENNPVVCVSWKDAQDYTAWLGTKSKQHYRLLTEAEYEYVNRAGSQTAYFWGDSAADLPRFANNNRQGATPVGILKPNAFDLYETTGNVYSWTLDCYHSSYNGAPTDGSAWVGKEECKTRVVRGGSWDADPKKLRSAYRANGDVDREIIGFRVARTF